MNRDEVMEEIEGFLDCGEEDEDYIVQDAGDSFVVTVNYEEE